MISKPNIVGDDFDMWLHLGHLQRSARIQVRAITLQIDFIIFTFPLNEDFLCGMGFVTQNPQGLMHRAVDVAPHRRRESGQPLAEIFQRRG